MNEFDSTRPNPARMYDYALGGKDNYAVDRAAADAILKVSSRAFEGAQQNRDFLRRAVRFAAIATVTEQYSMSPTPLAVRTLDEIKLFFDGFELADPGVVNIANWQFTPDEEFPLMCYGGVAFKK